MGAAPLFEAVLPNGEPHPGDDGPAARAGPVHLAAVGQKGARSRILATLAEAGFTPLKDFVAVA